MVKIEDLKKSVMAHRKALHQMPELAYEEFLTSTYIVEALRALGYEPQKVAGTGVIAYKKGLSEECVAFRADMDALSIKEDTDLPFASCNGLMHGCGHDGHMAILLGFAEHVARLPKLNKSILFIFQPAEEGPGGAAPILKEGVFQRYNVKNVFGLHLFPDIEQGKIGLRKGVMTAQTGEFDVIIKGRGGHGAMPHTANDALIVAAQLINSYQTIVSRNVNPIEGCVVTIGTIHGGERRNIICENLVLEGTIRAFSEEIYNQVKQRMVEINQGLAAMFNVKVEVVFHDLYPCINNDEKLVERIVQSDIGKNVIELDPMMIAEDFAFYQKVVPGVFFMLGSKNETLNYTYPLHHSKFNFDAEVLVHGLQLYDQVSQLFKIYEGEGAE
ncbi:MAG TPA: amidohydrolase [Firmicutes bacterium]|nr:amidohydrolase [Bacillota bacterium]